jgi:hypothetical protein
LAVELAVNRAEVGDDGGHLSLGKWFRAVNSP